MEEPASKHQQGRRLAEQEEQKQGKGDPTSSSPPSSSSSSEASSPRSSSEQRDHQQRPQFQKQDKPSSLLLRKVSNGAASSSHHHGHGHGHDHHSGSGTNPKEHSSNTAATATNAVTGTGTGTATAQNNNMSRSKAQLQEALDMLPDDQKQSYLQALKVAPKLVEIESDFERYLAFDKFDPWAAAKRIVDYWEARLDVFGPEKAYLPLVLSGQGALSPEDLDVLKTGFFMALPDNQHGRPVLYHDRARLTNPEVLNPERRMRCMFYIISAISERAYALLVLAQQEQQRRGSGGQGGGDGGGGMRLGRGYAKGGTGGGSGIITAGPTASCSCAPPATSNTTATDGHHPAVSPSPLDDHIHHEHTDVIDCHDPFCLDALVAYSNKTRKSTFDLKNLVDSLSLYVFRQSIPVRFARVHLVMLSSRPILNTVAPLTVQALERLGTKAPVTVVHTRKPIDDVQDDLKAHGFELEGLPKVPLGGLYTFGCFRRWIDDRLRRERRVYAGVLEGVGVGSGGLGSGSGASHNGDDDDNDHHEGGKPHASSVAGAGGASSFHDDDDGPEAALARKRREVDAAYARRKRARKKIEVKVLTAEVERLTKQQRSFQETGNDLERRLAEAQRLVQLYDEASAHAVSKAAAQEASSSSTTSSSLPVPHAVPLAAGPAAQATPTAAHPYPPPQLRDQLLAHAQAYHPYPTHYAVSAALPPPHPSLQHHHHPLLRPYPTSTATAMPIALGAGAPGVLPTLYVPAFPSVAAAYAAGFYGPAPPQPPPPSHLPVGWGTTTMTGGIAGLGGGGGGAAAATVAGATTGRVGGGAGAGVAISGEKDAPPPPAVVRGSAPPPPSDHPPQPTQQGMLFQDLYDILSGNRTS